MVISDPGLDPSAFVRAHTRLAPVPLIPEVILHQADDVFGLWETLERVLASREVPIPFWGFPWAGGIALARHVLDHPALARGRAVLDLATGSGLVAIAAARARAAAVTANDIDPIAIAAVDLNAALNSVAITPLLADLLDEPDHPLLSAVQVVLTGDIAYEHPMADRLFALLGRLVRQGVEVYIGDPGRPYLPGVGLEPLATYEVPVAGMLEDAAVKQSTVWRMRA